jgi:hypothetical protein
MAAGSHRSRSQSEERKRCRQHCHSPDRCPQTRHRSGLIAPWLPRPHFSMRAEPGGHHALPVAPRVSWYGGSTPVQISQL